MIRLLCFLRYIFMAPVAILWVILCSWATVLSCVVSGHRLREQKILHWWSKILMLIFNVRVVVTGQENLDEEGAILLFNHASLFDVTAIFTATQKVARFGAKVELFKVPIFGSAMRRVGILPITRNDREKVIQVYNEAKARTLKGESFILAPEGTRMDRPQIGPFKSGPFIFAINAQIPIVPVIVKGAYEVLPKHTLLINMHRWRSYIHVRFLPLIKTEGLTFEDREELKDRVRQIMIDAFEETQSTRGSAS